MGRKTCLYWNPVHSFLSFLFLTLNRRLDFYDYRKRPDIILCGTQKFQSFLKIHIRGKDNKPKTGGAVFRIVFHSARIPCNVFINLSLMTIPFFSGLPGFCNKQFMVNTTDTTFSGIYEWETVFDAQRYARSFAVFWMKKKSRPYPVHYEILDAASHTIIESKTIEFR